MAVTHDGVAPTADPVPASEAALTARIRELRVCFEPFLRSLPAPLEARSRRDLSGVWRWKFEVEDFTGGPRPAAPDWHRPDLDDADWATTAVPEWRYDAPTPAEAKIDPRAHRPDSRIVWYRTTFAAAAPSPGRRVFVAFAGATWETEVWLNGVFLGRHTAYWEPFRFEVTRHLRGRNVLAVRVLAGPQLGEPVSGWTVLSCALAEQPRHVRDAARSILGQRTPFAFKSSCFATGFGIHREVFLETTCAVAVAAIFVRGAAGASAATVRVETDALEDGEVTLAVQILPENFEGRAYRTTATRPVRHGVDSHTLSVPTPGARRWRPAEPCLYRCRVTLLDGERRLDAADALFGHRSFRLVTERDAARPLPTGLFLLNDEPVYLRGAAVSPALNTLWYWCQEDRLIDVLLMVKAGQFNAVRACEHVQFAEVRELQDRLGILSEQDLVGAGVGYVPPESGGAGNGAVPLATLGELAVRLARACYNHPGVVLLTTGGIETGFDPVDIVTAVLDADPERIVKPISGNMRDWGSAYECPPPDYPSLSRQQWDNVVNDFHCYNGWYRRGLPLSRLSEPCPPGRMLTVGEFGAEALDGYATMQRYPPLLQPPPATADRLWGHAQVKRGDPRLTIGLRGRRPHGLRDYIDASQTYQADALAEQVTGFRLSPQRIAGHFVFHLIDALPAEWQKSLVSFDGTPKRAFFALAQLNQPVLPLFRFLDEGRRLALWVANDRNKGLPGCRLGWRLEAADHGRVLLEGAVAADVAPLDATPIATIDLPPAVHNTPTVTVSLVLRDAAGAAVSAYRREVFLKAWRPPDYEIGEPPRTGVPRLASGDADGDPARVDWRAAAPLAGWRQVEGPPTDRRVEARVAHDGRYLYVKLERDVPDDDVQCDDSVWTSEGWEVFLAARRGKPYRQLGIDPRGAFLEVTSDPALPLCGPAVRSEAGPDGWFVLVAFPLPTLVPGGIRPGDVFYGNFYCKTGSGDVYREMLAWSPNGRPDFHVPERFGELTLE